MFWWYGCQLITCFEWAWQEEKRTKDQGEILGTLWPQKQGSWNLFYLKNWGLSSQTLWTENTNIFSPVFLEQFCKFSCCCSHLHSSLIFSFFCRAGRAFAAQIVCYRRYVLFKVPTLSACNTSASKITVQVSSYILVASQLFLSSWTMSLRLNITSVQYFRLLDHCCASVKLLFRAQLFLSRWLLIDCFGLQLQ